MRRETRLCVEIEMEIEIYIFSVTKYMCLSR